MNRDIVELREVIQKLVPLLAGKGLTVTQRGSQAYVVTNPRTRRPEVVNIPNISDNAKPDFIQAIQGFIDHEVAHVLITDWNYYCRGANEHELKKPAVQQFMNTHNIVEDTMIEREIVKIFPGSESNISDLRKYFLERVTKQALAGAKNEKEAFVYLLVPTMRALAGHSEMQEFMDKGGYWSNKYVDGVVKGLKPATLQLLKTCTSTKETLEIAEELHLILYPPAPSPSAKPKTPPPPPPPSTEPPEEAGPGDGKEKREHEEAGDDGEGDASGNPVDEPEADEEDDGQPVGGEEDAENDDADEASEDDDAGDSDEDINLDEDDGQDDDEADDADSDEADEDDAGEPGQPGDADSDGSEEGDEEGGAGGAGPGGDTDDTDDEGEDASGAAGASGEAGDEDSEGDSDASDTPRLRTEGDSGGGVGNVDMDVDDQETGAGGGVGAEAGKSIFDFDEDAFKEADMSSQIAVLISDEAVAAMDPSQYNVFTREFDRIEPVEPPERMNGKWIPEMEDEVRSMTGRMSKDIERIMASQSHIIRTPGHKRGRLHAPSLYRVPQGDPRVFTQLQEHKSKDTAVTLLCDNSGSMAGPKMKLAMISAYALSVTLDRVKIAHEVLGFTTGGYYNVPTTLRDAMQKDVDRSHIRYDRLEPIIIPIYKEFAERITATVKARFAYMMFAQNGLVANVDGESLEYAAERLLKRPEGRKVMLVLSDGQPTGSIKAGPHLSYVTRQLEKMGIECIGIGIMDRSVKNYYPKHAVLNNVDELPTQVMSELKRILA